MKSESGFGLAMASPFHFGTESCYIFDFFLLAISLTTIFQYGRSSIFGKCNHYFLGRHRAQQHGDAAHGLLNLLCLHHLGRGVPPQQQVLLQPSSCLPPPPLPQSWNMFIIQLQVALPVPLLHGHWCCQAFGRKCLERWYHGNRKNILQTFKRGKEDLWWTSFNYDPM